MNTIFKRLAAVLLCIMLLTGCEFNRTVSLTYNVTTGDSIKVTLDSSEGHGLKNSGAGFEVNNGEKIILQGFFVDQSMYEGYVEAVSSQQEAVIRQETDREEMHVISYTYEGQAGTEQNYIVWIEGSSTGVVIGSLAEVSEADEAFGRLVFSKE